MLPSSLIVLYIDVLMVCLLNFLYNMTRQSSIYYMLAYIFKVWRPFVQTVNIFYASWARHLKLDAKLNDYFNVYLQYMLDCPSLSIKHRIKFDFHKIKKCLDMHNYTIVLVFDRKTDSKKSIEYTNKLNSCHVCHIESTKRNANYEQFYCIIKINFIRFALIYRYMNFHNFHSS